MTPQDDQYIFLDELARRWRQDTDRIVELAISGALPLWISFTDVTTRHAEQKTPGSRKKKTKPPATVRHDQIDVRPAPEVLRQLLGRCDRMLIAAELACLDAKGTPMVLTNSVGDEWGEISMIGLKPITLFARLNDITTFEQKNGIIQRTVHIKQYGMAHQVSQTLLTVPAQEHPCFAPELHAAAACWHAFFASEATPAAKVSKAEILAWLHQHHPYFSQAAMERIALVLTPIKHDRR
ncbi:MAG: hypothetical protein FWD79_10760 [Desulfobulbus sp.]|nr:hypothetical protein [Desulfobulbus sp.]